MYCISISTNSKILLMPNDNNTTVWKCHDINHSILSLIVLLCLSSWFLISFTAAVCSLLLVHLPPYWQVAACRSCEINICADVEIPISLSEPSDVSSLKLLSHKPMSLKSLRTVCLFHQKNFKSDFQQTEKVKIKYWIVSLSAACKQYNKHKTASTFVYCRKMWNEGCYNQ